MNIEQTTTEELIVAYLDGELVRRELETTLFERLASSEEARQILHEHLVIRGAIRCSFEDERFELSDEIDARTKARLENVLQAIPAPAQTFVPRRMADAAPATTQQPERRLRKWALRPSYAALVLLLAIGSTWFVARTTSPVLTGEIAEVRPMPEAPLATPQASDPSSVASTQQQIESTQPGAAKQLGAATVSAGVNTEPRVIVRTVTKYVSVPTSASTVAADIDVAHQARTEEVEEPNDVMISRRFAKALKTTNSVVITQDDKLPGGL